VGLITKLIGKISNTAHGAQNARNIKKISKHAQNVAMLKNNENETIRWKYYF